MTISLHSTHRPSASTLWVLVLTAGSALSTFLLACATPFAAMAALAATQMNRRDGLMLMGLTWFANQGVGFACLGYPHTAKTFAWGAVLGLAALAAVAGAQALTARVHTGSAAARLGLAYVGAFAAFKAVVLVAALGLGGFAMLIAPSLLVAQFARDAVILLGLLALYHGLVALGVPAARRPLAAA